MATNTSVYINIDENDVPEIEVMVDFLLDSLYLALLQEVYPLQQRCLGIVIDCP